MMSEFLAGLRRFFSARSGNVAMLFGIVLVPVLLAAGMAIDLSRAGQARTQIQEASDAALLRAARVRAQQPNISDAELTALARRIFDASLTSLGGMTYTGFKVVYDQGTEALRLDVDGDLDTSILRAVGIRTMDIAVVSEVKPGKRPYLEVVLALDNTGSMNDGGKIGQLKTAAAQLIESIFTTPHSGVLVGLVPFAQYVNVGTGYKNESWIGASGASWTGCVGSRNYPGNIQDGGYETNPVPPLTGVTCPAPLMPLTANKAAALAAVNAMTASGWTYIPSGVVWGWRMLSPQAPFSEGVTYQELENRAGIKALIILTDGENTRAPSYPAHNSTSTALANSLLVSLCQAVKADGILVYSIAFDVDDSTIRGLLEDCATTPGHYFSADNSSELNAAFVEIGMTLRSLSLTR